MTEGVFSQRTGTARTTSIAIVVLMHGAGITALALSKMDMSFVQPSRTEVTFVDAPKPPPENVDKVETPAKLPTDIFVEKPVIDIEVLPPVGPPIETTDIPSPGGTGTADTGLPKVEPTPPPEPVRIEARIDSRSALQPPYPASEQRAGAEGLVSIRVVIGPDGRVKAVEKVKATSDAFYQATLRHALRNWRFTPATVDGRPVESRKVMTVRFEMNS